ncbi:MAG: hypothetical protein JWO91_2775 [Acidobacteriaceae bacterium]|nr:hypothetical protein [Acidobacteriaceae bacterium]
MIVDLLKRFTPTPIKTTVLLHGIPVRLETNCAAINSQLLEALALKPVTDSGSLCFVWKIVAEPSEFEELETESLEAHTLTHLGLRLVQIGRQTFLACDPAVREGISFVSADLANDQPRFHRHFAPALLSLMEQAEVQ